MSNATYKQDLHDIAIAVAQVCKNYTDKVADDLKWELGTYDLSVDSDTTSAYQKVVPVNSIEAKINTLGGMSYKVNQMFNYTEIPTDSRITNNNDGTFTINNNNTTGGYLNLSTIAKEFVANHKYLVVGWFITSKTYIVITGTTYAENNSNFIYATTSSGTATIYWRQYADTNIENVKVIPQFFDLTANFGSGNEPTSVSDCASAYLQRGINIYEYTPQQSAIRDTVITNVKSSNNLLKLNDVAQTTEKGITYSVKDGVITLNGTATGSMNLGFNFDVSIPNGTYSVNLFSEGTLSVNWGWVLYDAGYTIQIRMDSDTNTNKTITAPIVRISKSIATGHVFTNYKIKPMVVYGGTAPTEFKPYFNTNLAINASIQALDGYGWGVNDTCYNYIDFNSKKFIKKVGRVDLGSLNYNIDTNRIASMGISSNVKIPGSSSVPNIICSNKYTTASFNDIYSHSSDLLIGIRYESGELSIWDNYWYNNWDAEAFKTAMSGVYLYYELATPVETDISAYLTTNKITVEGGGTLIAENTYGASVPSDIDYLKEEVKA